jgi:prepilin-type processing-associated H-X9-DG protein
LASLLLSALSNARAKGLQTQCANNLRQLGLAQEQFVSEHHGYPFSGECLNPPDGFPKERWQEALGPYAGGYRLNTDKKPWQSAGLFHCPAANPPSCPTFPEGIVYIDYGYNAVGISRFIDTNGSLGLSPWMGSSTNQPEPLPVSPFEVNQPVRESQIASPADMMAIGDGFVGNSRFIADASGLWRSAGLRQDYPPGSSRRANARHRGKAEVVFCDGHVEGPRLRTLFADESDAALSRWNRDNQPHRERLIP